MACTIDFRSLDEGFGGKTFKRKRAEQEAEKLKLLDDGMDVDNGNPPPSKRQAVPCSDDPQQAVRFVLGKADVRRGDSGKGVGSQVEAGKDAAVVGGAGE